MARCKTRAEWLDDAHQMLDHVEAVHTTRPHATWAEIEAAVDGALSPWRRDVWAGSVHGHALADFRGADERPPCPHGGAALQAAGQGTRAVVTQGGDGMQLERTRGRCPGCGAGIPPPSPPPDAAFESCPRTDQPPD